MPEPRNTGGHPALARAWAWFEDAQLDMEYDRQERLAKILAEMEVELYRIDQAQYVPAAGVSVSGDSE